MQEAFRLGGWGMYPTLFVGIVLMIAAARFAASPRGRFHTIVALGVLTAFVSCLGFVTGVIRTMLSAGQLEPGAPGHVVIIGIGESLHNIGLGLCQLVIATLLVVVGLSRRTRSAGATAVDPHNA